jgi:hypothetical protein
VSLANLLVNVLIALLVIGLCWYVAKLSARRLGAGEPVPVILDVIFALVALIWLLGILGVGGWGGRVIVL